MTPPAVGEQIILMEGARGEWYYPNGTEVPPPGGDDEFYRTRDHMIIRLNRASGTIGF